MSESPDPIIIQALMTILKQQYPHIYEKAVAAIIQNPYIEVQKNTNTITMGKNNIYHHVTIQQGNLIIHLPDQTDPTDIHRFQIPIDIDLWATLHTAWMHEAFLTTDNARARLGQKLALGNPKTHHVSRPDLSMQMNNWYATWATQHQPLVILGDEGDGKTWMGASWIYDFIQTEDSPPVVFFASDAIDDTDIPTLMVHAIQQATHLDEAAARALIPQWEQHPSADQRPSMIWVFDGLNQHHSHVFWRTILETLQGIPWRDRIAVILTCRTAYWNTNFAPISAKQITVPPYTDIELADALTVYDLKLHDLHPDLHPLARKPRYLDLIVKHRETLTTSGDVTVARLIYEDWKDRYARKRIGLTDNDFQNVMRDLAEQHLQGASHFRWSDLVSALPLENHEDHLRELRTGGILTERRGKFILDEHRLVLGLALVLIEALETQGQAPDEQIAQWLEPYPAIDLYGKICEQAALIALQEGLLTEEARCALLYTWITYQNTDNTILPSFTAYYTLSQSVYRHLAERIWLNPRQLRWAQHHLVHLFLKDFQPSMPKDTIDTWRPILERWLGYVHRFNITSAPIKTTPDDQQHAAHNKILARLGFDRLDTGNFVFAEYPFTSVDQEEYRSLALLALTLISHGDRPAFAKALTIGCLAELIMSDHPTYRDEVAWLIRSSSFSLWHALKAHILHLQTVNHLLAHKTGVHLAEFVGTHEAMNMRSLFPRNLYPRWDIDVCRISWHYGTCLECMDRSDISLDHRAKQLSSFVADPDLPHLESLTTYLPTALEALDQTQIAMTTGRTSEDHALEIYEPLACVYGPDVFARFIHRLTNHLTERSGEALSQLALMLQRYTLLFNQEQLDRIRQIWADLCTQHLSNDSEETHAEWWLFEILLSHLNSHTQLALFLDRPEAWYDLVRFNAHFQEPTEWNSIWTHLTNAHDDLTRVRRILYFIETHVSSLSPTDIEIHLLPLIHHSNDFIRLTVLRIIYRAQDPVANSAIVTQISTQAASYDEQNLFSLIHCDYGHDLTPDEIRTRIHPRYLGYAAHHRNKESSLIHAYISYLQHHWKRLIEYELPDIPPELHMTMTRHRTEDRAVRRWYDLTTADQTIRGRTRGTSWSELHQSTSFETLQKVFDFTSQERERTSQATLAERVRDEQDAAHNDWFDHPVFWHDLDLVYMSEPEQVRAWAQDIIDHPDESQRRIRLAGRFYEALCALLLQREPNLGIKLYWTLLNTPMAVMQIDPHTKIWELDTLLFTAPHTSSTEAAWTTRIHRCLTDRDLLEVLIALQQANLQAWLLSHVTNLLANKRPHDQLQAYAILSFLDKDDSQHLLTTLYQDSPESWIRETLDQAQRRWKTNAWAKHWFKEFIYAQDDVQAWAGFRLFLACVDRRFWLWKDQYTDLLSSSRQRFLTLNRETIKHRITKNEQPFEKTLYGQKIPHQTLWPWLQYRR